MTVIVLFTCHSQYILFMFIWIYWVGAFHHIWISGWGQGCPLFIYYIYSPALFNVQLLKFNRANASVARTTNPGPLPWRRCNGVTGNNKQHTSVWLLDWDSRKKIIGLWEKIKRSVEADGFCYKWSQKKRPLRLQCCYFPSIPHTFRPASSPSRHLILLKAGWVIMRTSTKCNTTPVWSIVVATAATWSRLPFMSTPSPPRQQSHTNTAKYSPSCGEIECPEAVREL